MSDLTPENFTIAKLAILVNGCMSMFLQAAGCDNIRHDRGGSLEKGL